MLNVGGRQIAQNGKLIAILEDRSKYAARTVLREEDFVSQAKSVTYVADHFQYTAGLGVIVPTVSGLASAVRPGARRLRAGHPAVLQATFPVGCG